MFYFRAVCFNTKTMSKSTRRRSARLEMLQNDSSTISNHVTRSPKNSPNTQFKNNLNSRNKLDITFTKVSKPANNPNQHTNRSIFRSGSLFASKDNISRSNDADIRKLPNTSNSITNQRVSTNMDQDQSSNITSSNITSNFFNQFSIPESSATFGKNNSPDSSSTFYEPDSTVDDELESDLIFDSNGPIDETVLTKNTTSNIPIYNKSLLEREICKVTPRKNTSVKKLTQHKPGSVKTSTPQKVKTVIRKTNRKTSQANSSQDSLLGEFGDISMTYSSHQNSSKKNTSACKETNSIRKVVATIKRSNLEKLSQHRLQTPVLSSPLINSKLSTCKSKPKNSPLVCKNPPTLKSKSKPTVSPELFVSDHDSNQAFSSNDLLLPSPNDLTKLDRTLVCRNRLETPRDTNSASATPVTNSSHHLQKALRYPIRSITSLSPVIYDLPAVHRKRSNSTSVLSKFDDSSSKTSIRSRSKIPTKKPTTPKPIPLQFSQCSSVHESLLNISTPQDTPNDVYEFVSTTPLKKPQTTRKKKKETNSSQKAPAKRTPAKTSIRCKPNSNPSLLAPIIEPRGNVSTIRKPTLQTKTIFNTNAFSDLTNQTPKKNRAASKDGAREGNFLTGTFSQHPSSQQKSIFGTPSSQATQNFTNLNRSLNSPQSFFNRPTQSQRNYSQTYGSLLAYIDNINHNNNDAEMDELCDLFSLLNISDKRTHWKNSFSNYRDPCRIEKPYVKKHNKSCENPLRKISLLGNAFVNYRLSSKPIAEGNETPFSPIPAKNSITNGINFHQSESVATDVPNNATEDLNLSARSVIKSITKISRKVPHYFYADGPYNFDGFSTWQ